MKGLKPRALALRKAYFDALKNNFVTPGGYTVPVYDTVFDQGRFPYVVIGNHESQTRSGGSSLGSKTDWIEDITLNVYVYGGRVDQYSSKKLTHEIAETLTDTITNNRGQNLNFGPGASTRVIFATLQSQTATTEAWQTGRVHVVTLEFFNKVEFV